MKVRLVFGLVTCAYLRLIKFHDGYSVGPSFPNTI